MGTEVQGYKARVNPEAIAAISLPVLKRQLKPTLAHEGVFGSN